MVIYCLSIQKGNVSDVLLKFLSLTINTIQKNCPTYIRDASKYSKAIIEETGEVLAEKVYLQVEKNADKISETIKQYAIDKKVEIIDDITAIFK